MKVGDAKVTQAEFDQFYSDLEGQGGEDADLTREKAAQQYATALMLSQGAVANHLDTSPEVERQLKVDRIQILSNAEYARLEKQAKPTPEEISQYYSAHLSDYDEVSLRRIYVWKKREGGNTKGLTPEEARARAQAIRQALESGGDPKKLTQGSDDSIDIEPITLQRGEVSQPLRQAAFEGKVGEWSEILDTPDALVLVQVVKRWQRSLAEVTPLIERRLKAQKMRAILEENRKNAGVWMDESYFESKKAPESAAKKPVSSAVAETEGKHKQ